MSDIELFLLERDLGSKFQHCEPCKLLFFNLKTSHSNFRNHIKDDIMKNQEQKQK